MTAQPHWLLTHVNPHGETHYFVGHGAWHGKIRLIEFVTTDITKAHPFATEEEANAAWRESGRPVGWTVAQGRGGLKL